MIERAPLPWLATVSLVAASTGAMMRPATVSRPTQYSCATSELSAAQRRLVVVKQERDPVERLICVSPTADELEQKIKRELIAREDDMVGLARHLCTLQLPRTEWPEPVMTPSEPLNRALYAQSHDVDGCFQEWAERQPTGTDARLIVTLVVTDDGVGHRLNARFPDLPSNDKEQVGVLPTCVAPALLRVKFPTMPRDVDARVTITWVDKTLGFSTVVQPHVVDDDTLLL